MSIAIKIMQNWPKIKYISVDKNANYYNAIFIKNPYKKTSFMKKKTFKENPEFSRHK